MEYSKILTIVIPAYNVERYINKCLDSVVKSKYLSELDVIVVNDGSKDGTLALARPYEVRYPTSVRVIDKPNGGWGTGINRGIEEASGKYLKTLDSDDWFDTDGLDKLIDALRAAEVDMAVTSTLEVTDEGEILQRKTYPTAKSGILRRDDFLQLNNFGIVEIHSITYRTALLKGLGKDLISPKYYGDIDYDTILLPHVKNILSLDIVVYNYLKGREGQSVSIAGYNAHLEDFINVAKKLVLFYENNERGESKVFKATMNRCLSLWVGRVYYLLLSPVYSGDKPTSCSELKSFDRFLHTHSETLYKAVGSQKIRKFIPYIKFWRAVGLNVFKLRWRV